MPRSLLLGALFLALPLPLAAAEDWRRHWAFQRPLRPAVPPVAGARNPIDAFLFAEHARHGLRASAPAPRHVLLRRVSLDLVGLPPTRAELHAFLADKRPEAYERLVERLLASPQHGERWARHWMDLWRYSDWYGRRAVPDVWNSAPQVWRWRDWIVASLNADKGYDRMVQEMLAADEVAPGDDEAAVATGYLVRNWYALNPNQWLRDAVEHTGKAFLGLTLNCAHCHDHKYDPISQEEYFRFRAFFEPIQVRQDRVQGEPDPGPFQKYSYSVLRKVVPFGRVSVFDERPDAPTFIYRAGDERNRVKDRPPVRPGAPAFLGGDRLKIEPVALPVEAWYPGSKRWVQQEEVARRDRDLDAARHALAGARQALARARARLAEAETQLPPGRPAPPMVADARAQARAAVAAAEQVVARAEARRATAVAQRAAIRARVAADNARYRKGPGAAALARAAARAERSAGLCAARERLLSAGHSAAARHAVALAEQALVGAGDRYTLLSPVYPAASTGRRRALALWLTSRDNPLTARVAVNHVWKWHFGRPLVETVFDFGRNGKPPSHPALLDWLAVELMESGWSLKHLHRLIVTSAAYRQASSGPDAASRAADPDNRWLWRFGRRRVEAEVVRDSVLHAAGELDVRLGGPPLANNVPETAARRRSLYFSVYPEDGGHPKFLELFDAPDPCDCYRRSASIVPQQALALTNSALLLANSRRLARKLGPPAALADEAFVVAAFEQVLSRRPSLQELAVCRAFLRRQVELFRKKSPATADPGLRAREGLIRVLFNHDDFITIR
jgi:hypothetical protein